MSRVRHLCRPPMRSLRHMRLLRLELVQPFLIAPMNQTITALAAVVGVGGRAMGLGLVASAVSFFLLARARFALIALRQHETPFSTMASPYSATISPAYCLNRRSSNASKRAGSPSMPGSCTMHPIASEAILDTSDIFALYLHQTNVFLSLRQTITAKL